MEALMNKPIVKTIISILLSCLTIVLVGVAKMAFTSPAVDNVLYIIVGVIGSFGSLFGVAIYGPSKKDRKRTTKIGVNVESDE
jgi:hypothetical protein